MHWFLLVGLVVASSIDNDEENLRVIGNEENLQKIALAPPRTDLPTCDVFLAPSTIPGSACMRA